MASAGSLTNEDFIFQAKLDSVGTIATLLKSVAFTDVSCKLQLVIEYKILIN